MSEDGSKFSDDEDGQVGDQKIESYIKKDPFEPAPKNKPIESALITDAQNRYTQLLEEVSRKGHIPLFP